MSVWTKISYRYLSDSYVWLSNWSSGVSWGEKKLLILKICVTVQVPANSYSCLTACSIILVFWWLTLDRSEAKPHQPWCLMVIYYSAPLIIVKEKQANTTMGMRGQGKVLPLTTLDLTLCDVCLGLWAQSAHISSWRGRKKKDIWIENTWTALSKNYVFKWPLKPAWKSNTNQVQRHQVTAK